MTGNSISIVSLWYNGDCLVHLGHFVYSQTAVYINSQLNCCYYSAVQSVKVMGQSGKVIGYSVKVIG